MLAQNDPEGAPENAGQPKEVEKKTSSKLVRLMTVMAYLMSVSMAAILLSIYYLCIWKSPVLSDLEMEEPLEPSEYHQDAGTFEYQRAYIDNGSVPYNLPGGSSTTINETDVQLPPSTISYQDVHEPSEVIDTSVTEPTHSNSSFPYNVTTESEVVSGVTTVTAANDRTPPI